MRLLLLHLKSKIMSRKSINLFFVIPLDAQPLFVVLFYNVWASYGQTLGQRNIAHSQ